jgi:hypothetical protein
VPSVAGSGQSQIGAIRLSLDQDKSWRGKLFMVLQPVKLS